VSSTSTEYHLLGVVVPSRAAARGPAGALSPVPVLANATTVEDPPPSSPATATSTEYLLPVVVEPPEAAVKKPAGALPPVPVPVLAPASATAIEDRPPSSPSTAAVTSVPPPFALAPHPTHPAHASHTPTPGPDPAHSQTPEPSQRSEPASKGSSQASAQTRLWAGTVVSAAEDWAPGKAGSWMGMKVRETQSPVPA